MSDATPDPQRQPQRELGFAAYFGVLIGGGCLLVALLGVINTAIDGSWDRGCVLGGAAVGPEFVKLALDRGVGPDSCPNSESLIWTVVNGQQDDATTAKIVTMLAAAGWSTTATPEFSEDATAVVAERHQKPETLAALGRSSSSSHE